MDRLCPACERGKLTKADDIILEISGYVFVVKGDRCAECREEYPFEDETQRVIEASRKVEVGQGPLKLYKPLSKSGSGQTPSFLEASITLCVSSSNGYSSLH